MISRLAQMGLGNKQTGFIPTLEMNVSAHTCSVLPARCVALLLRLTASLVRGGADYDRPSHPTLNRCGGGSGGGLSSRSAAAGRWGR